ncbi:hypothetical protein ACIBK9_09640 [Nonomuraea sp. NPDC050227]|uniref:hypothetical protein n=1 Tax=Nonomuraea sp. NPDC050227 TaxID=3364360 RepID=UPI00378EBE19
MDLMPRWPAAAAALAFVLAGGGMLLPAQAAAGPPPTLVQAAHDDGGDDDGDDGDDDRAAPRSGRREPARKQAHAPRRDDDVEAIPGLEARDSRPPEPVTRPPEAPGRAEIRLESGAMTGGGHVGPLVLLAILGTGALVGASYWLSRRYGP